MNAFEKHGVYHLSPSRINKWIEQPALCLLEIAGIKDQAGPSAWRGTATDKAVTKASQEPLLDLDSIKAYAHEVFDGELLLAERPNEKSVEKERGNLDAYVESGVNWIQTIEPVTSAQGKVVVELDDVPVPVHGYYDLLTETSVRDMKTGLTTPKELKAKHGRQMAIYVKATQREAWIDFISKKGVTSFKVDNIPFWERNFIVAAQSLERTLAMSDDIFECCQQVFPDLDGMYGWMWSDKQRRAAIDIWNLEGLTNV